MVEDLTDPITPPEAIEQEGASILDSSATTREALRAEAAPDATDDVAVEGVAEQIAEGTATNPGTQEERTSYNDSEVAHARFIAEHKDRSDAVEVEDLTRRVESYKPAESTDDYPPQTYQQRQNSYTKAMEDNPAYQRLDDYDIPNPINGVRAYDLFSRAESPGRRREELVGAMKRGSERLHELAERKGDWAEVLEKSPPSTEFLETHHIKPEYLTPDHLIRVEEKIGDQRRTAEWWDRKPGELMEAVERDKHKPEKQVTIVSMIDQSIYEEGNREAYAEFQELTSKDETTVGDIKKFYQAYVQKEADAFRFTADATEAILEQIRSGTASSTPPTPEVVAA